MLEHAQTGLHERDQNFFGCVLFEYVLYFVEDETALSFNVGVFVQLDINSTLSIVDLKIKLDRTLQSTFA